MQCWLKSASSLLQPPSYNSNFGDSPRQKYQAETSFHLVERGQGHGGRGGGGELLEGVQLEHLLHFVFPGDRGEDTQTSHLAQQPTAADLLHLPSPDE
jgi:hypothetical protein